MSLQTFSKFSSISQTRQHMIFRLVWLLNETSIGNIHESFSFQSKKKIFFVNNFCQQCHRKFFFLHINWSLNWRISISFIWFDFRHTYYLHLTSPIDTLTKWFCFDAFRFSLKCCFVYLNWIEKFFIGNSKSKLLNFVIIHITWALFSASRTFSRCLFAILMIFVQVFFVFLKWTTHANWISAIKFLVESTLVAEMPVA